MSPRLFRGGDRRVFVGPEHRLADRRGWCSLERLVRSDAPAGAPRWRVRCYEHGKGYVHVLCGPGHPYANKGGKVLLHRLIVATHLRRVLSRHEHVHHANEIKGDLRLTNLPVLEEAEHGRYHYGQRCGCGRHVCAQCQGAGCSFCQGGVTDRRPCRLNAESAA